MIHTVCCSNCLHEVRKVLQNKTVSSTQTWNPETATGFRFGPLPLARSLLLSSLFVNFHVMRCASMQFLSTGVTRSTKGWYGDILLKILMQRSFVSLSARAEGFFVWKCFDNETRSFFRLGFEVWQKAHSEFSFGNLIRYTFWAQSLWNVFRAKQQSPREVFSFVHDSLNKF